MKTVKLLVVLMATLTIVSCGGDEGGQPANRILIDGDAYTIGGMYYDAQGSVCRTDSEEGACSHDRYVIFFTDGVYGEEDVWPSDYDFLYWLDLRCPDTENFQLGPYDLVKGQISIGDNDAIAWSNLEWPTNDSWDIEGEITFSGSFPDNVTVRLEATVLYFSDPARTDGTPDASLEITGFFKGAALPRTAT